MWRSTKRTVVAVAACLGLAGSILYGSAATAQWQLPTQDSAAPEDSETPEDKKSPEVNKSPDAKKSPEDAKSPEDEKSPEAKKSPADSNPSEDKKKEPGITVRVSKQVRRGYDGAWAKTVEGVPADSVVQYVIAPSLTGKKGQTYDRQELWVEECLPASTTFMSAYPQPDVVAKDTPDDAKRPGCEAGETYLRWKRSAWVNAHNLPITVTAAVAADAQEGGYTTFVEAWTEADSSAASRRRSTARILISETDGVRLTNTALTPQVAPNVKGQTKNEAMKWRVELANHGTESLSNPDVIVSLPKREQGVEVNFTSVNLSSSAGEARVLYTAASDVEADPGHESNGKEGRAWCDAPGGKAVIGWGTCPSTPGDVTALRLQRPDQDFKPGEKFSAEISVDVLGKGRSHATTAMAKVDGLQEQPGVKTAAVKVVDSGFYGRAWWDFNGDGLNQVKDNFAEFPAQGIRVQVTGTDDLGNSVDVSLDPWAESSDQQIQTNHEGFFSVAGLRPSNDDGYTLTFTGPDGTEFTSRGAEGGMGSDVDPAGGTTTMKLDRGQKRAVNAGAIGETELTITKKKPESADENAEFRFEVKCQKGYRVNPDAPESDVVWYNMPLAQNDREFTLKVGESKTLTTFFGTSCHVTETPEA